MLLITVAHPGEAQSLIEGFELKKGPSYLYLSPRVHLLITGEGPIEAGQRLAFYLGQQTYKQVLNLGICGALDAAFEMGSRHRVRCIYLAIDEKPQYRSFPLQTEGLDLVTSFSRILRPEKAQVLTGVASLVDREAWGLAAAAKEAQVPFESYKWVSDQAGTLEACELVQAKAHEFSEQFFEFACHYLLPQTPQQVPELKVEGCYFTFSSQKKLATLLKRKLIQEPQFDLQLYLADLLLKKISPKERGKELIYKLEQSLDPFKCSLQAQFAGLTQSLRAQGITLTTDPSWESDLIKFQFSSADSKDLHKKLAALEDFKFHEFQALRDGQLRVE